MVKRIIRAYGAAQDDEDSNVESVAKLAGVVRPSVSSNNNFLRSIGVVDMDKPKLTALGMKFYTGLSMENATITVEALQDLIRTTPIFNQLLNTLRARGSMELEAFKAQVILATGLKANSPGLATIKTLTDIFEESGLVEIRDDKIILAGQSRTNDNGIMQYATQDRASQSGDVTLLSEGAKVTQSLNNSSWTEQLLAKFPALDPTWPDDVKLKWFDAFDRLMKGRGM